MSPVNINIRCSTDDVYRMVYTRFHHSSRRRNIRTHAQRGVDAATPATEPGGHGTCVVFKRNVGMNVEVQRDKYRFIAQALARCSALTTPRNSSDDCGV